MILLVDNNDSFTHNILELLRKVTSQKVSLIKSKLVNLEDIEPFSHIIFSPGPGKPDDFPEMHRILQKFDNSKTILGICLGHQAICQYYGAQLTNLAHPSHGASSTISCDPNSTIFKGIETMTVGRYHSWIVTDIPSTLRITATDPQNTVMAIQHTTKQIFGIQFHPESFITIGGEQIIRNFLDATAQ